MACADHAAVAPARWIEDAERLDLAVTPPSRDADSVARRRDEPALARGGLLAVVDGFAARSHSPAGAPAGGRPRTGSPRSAVSSAVVNPAVKPLARRRAPTAWRARCRSRATCGCPAPLVPSGHSAAAFAFATGVGHVSPAAAVPLRALAALVAYSRVHTGVHYPGDVLVGALIGTALAQLTTYAGEQRPGPPARPEAGAGGPEFSARRAERLVTLCDGQSLSRWHRWRRERVRTPAACFWILRRA